MTDPFVAVNCYVRKVMENAHTVPADVNKPSAGWVTHVYCWEPRVRVKTKRMHDSIEQATYEVREAICNRLITGKGLPDLC